MDVLKLKYKQCWCPDKTRNRMNKTTFRINMFIAAKVTLVLRYHISWLRFYGGVEKYKESALQQPLLNKRVKLSRTLQCSHSILCQIKIRLLIYQLPLQNLIHNYNICLSALGQGNSWQPIVGFCFIIIPLLFFPLDHFEMKYWIGISLRSCALFNIIFNI